MNKDGLGTLDLSETLLAKSADRNRALEAGFLKQHAQLEESLNASLKNVLCTIEESTRSHVTEIRKELTGQKNRIMMDLAEIEIRPVRTLRKTMIWSALIGGIVAMLPWAVMSYLGMRASETTVGYWERIAQARAEEERIIELKGVEIRTIGRDKVLILPVSTTHLFRCGDDQVPCIKLTE